jgi:hypothetical protein
MESTHPLPPPSSLKIKINVILLTLTFTLALAVDLGATLTDQPSSLTPTPPPTLPPEILDDSWHEMLADNGTDLKDQIDSLTKARYLLFPHIYRAFIDAGRAPKAYNVSEGCQKDLTKYYWALNQQKAWAWRCECN